MATPASLATSTRFALVGSIQTSWLSPPGAEIGAGGAAVGAAGAGAPASAAPAPRPRPPPAAPPPPPPAANTVVPPSRDIVKVTEGKYSRFSSSGDTVILV